MFVTSFYSYKGGVGRTVALLNVTWELAHRGWRVAILDLDLEAPGLQDACLKSVSSAKTPAQSWSAARPLHGFCTLVRDYQAGTTAATIRDNIEKYLVENLGPDGRIALLPAHGSEDPSYDAFVDEFSWVDFYLSEGRPGKAVTAALVAGLKQRRYDYLLIDARTGLTDVRGATLVDMPDLVVLVTNLSTQSVKGVAQQLADIKSVNDLINAGQGSPSRRPGREATPIKTLVVGSPLPSGELLRRQIRISQIEKLLNRPLDCQVDYVPFLALEEEHQIVAHVTERHGAVHRRTASPYQDLTDAIVKLNPLAPENLLTQANELLKLGRWREALAHYDEIVDESAGTLPAHILHQAHSGKTWAQLRAVTQIDKALDALNTQAVPPAEEAERRLGAAWALVVAERFKEAAIEAETAQRCAAAAAQSTARERNVTDPDERFLIALSGFAAGQARGLDSEWERAAELLHKTHQACQASGAQPLLHALTLAEMGRVAALIGAAAHSESPMIAARRLPVRSTYVKARVALAEGEWLAETGRGVAALAQLAAAARGFDGDTDVVGALEAIASAAEIDTTANAESLAPWQQRADSLVMLLMACHITVMRAERCVLAGEPSGAIVLLNEVELRLGEAGPLEAMSRGEAQQRAEWCQAHFRIALIGNNIDSARVRLGSSQRLLDAATAGLGEIGSIPLLHRQRLLTALLALKVGDSVDLEPWAELLDSRGLVTRALQARMVQALDARVASRDALVVAMTRAEELAEWQWNLPIAFVAHADGLREQLAGVLRAASCPWPTVGRSA